MLFFFSVYFYKHQAIYFQIVQKAAATTVPLPADENNRNKKIIAFDKTIITSFHKLNN